MVNAVNHWLTNFVKIKPASPTPMAVVTDAGRKAERSDVLVYLAALATSTGSEELWEAVGHIQEGQHVREGHIGVV